MDRQDTIPGLPGFGPVAPFERIETLDILRGFALLGILLVNMTMDLPWIRLIPQRTSETWVNHPLYRGIDILAEGKFYILFSFLFGLGFFIQMSRAESRGTAFFPTYIRRLLVLYGIGLVLGLLTGESQLRIYATLGFVLLFLRRLPQKVLFPLALACLLFTPVRDLAEAWQRRDDPTAIRAQWEQHRNALAERTRQQQEKVHLYKSASFEEITRSHVPRTFWEWSWLTGEFPFLLLGFYAGRREIFKDVTANRRFFRKIMWYGLTFGLFACLLAHVIFERRQLWAEAAPTWWGRQVADLLDHVGSPALSFSYGAGLVLLLSHERWRDILLRLANVGRLALSNYILQWLVFVFLTYSYGLALYGNFGLAVGLAFSFGLFTLQVVLSGWYLKRFRMGPAEWFWRSLTYWKLQPMRKKQ